MADIHPSLVDKRIVERNIKKGLITRKDYEKHLSDLRDRADNAEFILTGADDDDDDDDEGDDGDDAAEEA